MKKGFHISKVNKYPEAPILRLPMNVSEIFANETSRFTPERIRDIYSSTDVKQFSNSSKIINLDLHVASYDCFGTVSLNSSMQTNVPKPFNSTGKSNYLNMPGGQWARDEKYIADDMQKSHYKCQLLKQNKKNGSFRNSIALNSQSRNYSTQSNTINPSTAKSSKTEDSNLKLTTKQKLDILIKDYGKTIIVFHVGISLLSLGGFYFAISSGLDMHEIVSTMCNDEMTTKLLSESSTFTLAYGIHKLFAPIRIMITLAVAPALVRFLRRKGILKHPEIIKKLKEAKLQNNQKT
ncbi:uncharacterized protein C18orf19 homolog A-like isoform X2 [Leptopilina boulardi]|nr:uncharacterized protein C18orf19 homolog A-like isoform X2 [Leptopilina boulardi]